MITAGLAAVILTMVLALVRALLGPSLYDRILAVNLFGTKTVLLIALLSFLDPDVFGQGAFGLDVALVYALINFVGIVAVLKFFEYGSLGTGRQDTEGGP